MFAHQHKLGERLVCVIEVQELHLGNTIHSLEWYTGVFISFVYGLGTCTHKRV